MLVQNDDFGRAYEESFKEAIKGTDITVAKVETYQAGVQTDVSPQVTSLAATNADAFFNGATLVPCPSALNKASELNWKPILHVSGTCLSRTLMGVAGQAGDKAVSATNLMDPQNPDWDSDANMKDYVETLTAYAKAEGLDNPDELYLNGAAGYGWTQAAILVKALEAAKELTRSEVVASLRNLDLKEVGLVFPDLSIKTGPDDPFMGESLKLVQYDFAGTHFKPLEGDADYEGKTGDLTPPDLIAG